MKKSRPLAPREKRRQFKDEDVKHYTSKLDWLEVHDPIRNALSNCYKQELSYVHLIMSCIAHSPFSCFIVHLSPEFSCMDALKKGEGSASGEGIGGRELLSRWRRTS
jgi:hypothetical protein